MFTRTSLPPPPTPLKQPSLAQRWEQEHDPDGLLPFGGHPCQGEGSALPPHPRPGLATLVPGCRGALGGTVTPGHQGLVGSA